MTGRRGLGPVLQAVALAGIVAVVPRATMVDARTGPSSAAEGKSPRYGTPVATIPVGRAPAGIAIDPRRHRAYVTGADDDTLTVIDTRGPAVIATVPIGPEPVGVAVDLGTGRVYVEHHGAPVPAPGDTRGKPSLDIHGYPDTTLLRRVPLSGRPGWLIGAATYQAAEKWGVQAPHRRPVLELH